MPLRKPADVTMEQKRVYRLALNGQIGTDELTRLTYALKEIRSSMIADAPPDIALAPGGFVVDTVNIIGVPSGTFLSKEAVEASLSQFEPEPPPSGTITRSPPMLRLYEPDADDRT
jgi:hypothetical protein